jgi:general secretion pathway protein G
MKKGLSILAILFLLIGCKKMTEKDKTFAIMTALDEALKRYRHDCSQFPPNEVGLKGLVDNPAGCAKWKGPYIEWGIDITKDAWGRDFVYQLVEEGKAAIVSYGADGKPGGDGQDSDLTFEVKKRQKGMM